MSGVKRSLRERDENGKAKKAKAEKKPSLLDRFLDEAEDVAAEAWEVIIDRLNRSPDIPFSKDKEDRHAFTNFVISAFDSLFDILADDSDEECECDDSSESEEVEESLTEEDDESLPSDALESDDPSSFDGESDEDDPDAEVSIGSDDEEIAVSNDE